jgi:hypothetical protein
VWSLAIVIANVCGSVGTKWSKRRVPKTVDTSTGTQQARVTIAGRDIDDRVAVVRTTAERQVRQRDDLARGVTLVPAA